MLQNKFLSIIVSLRFQLSLVFRPVFKTITSTLKQICFQAMSRTHVDMTSECKDMLANQKPEDKQKWPFPPKWFNSNNNVLFLPAVHGAIMYVD